MNTEGLRPPHSNDPIQRSHRGNGDGMTTNGKLMQHGKSHRWERVTLKRDAREGQARPSGMADRLVVPLKPVNAGGGKEPEFKIDVRMSLRARRLA